VWEEIAIVVVAEIAHTVIGIVYSTTKTEREGFCQGFCLSSLSFSFFISIFIRFDFTVLYVKTGCRFASFRSLVRFISFQFFPHRLFTRSDRRTEVGSTRFLTLGLTTVQRKKTLS
jgi:hypothetical protein